MKRIAVAFLALFILNGGTVFAQAEMDAYKYSKLDLHGTARFSSMGGAFGALGGDISAMTTNPAGLGIYRSSEIVTTANLSFIGTNATWNNNTLKDNSTRFNFDNIAYVGFFPTGNFSGIKSWNVGFAYNRVKNFHRDYSTTTSGGQSLSDYIAEITNQYGYSESNLWETDSYNPYLSRNGYNYLSLLGYNSGIIATSSNRGFVSSFSERNASGELDLWPVEYADLQVSERGAIDKYDFSFATNISDILFLGGTMTLTDIDYAYNSYYEESFGFAQNAKTDDYMYIRNSLLTKGSGYSVNLGAIVRPSDFIRIGVAYNSPTWYKMTDTYYSEAESYIHPEGALYSDTPDSYLDYNLRTSDRWIFSLAGIVGASGVLSVDYELNNYGTMKLGNDHGVSGLYDFDNSQIKNHFRTTGTLRVGGELKITPQFAIRAGGAFTGSPMKDIAKDGSVEIYTAETFTHYTIDKGTNYYTAGLGYRFTPNFYMDLACIYKEQKEDAYAFSNVYNNNGTLVVEAESAALKTKTTRISLTFGYKF